MLTRWIYVAAFMLDGALCFTHIYLDAESADDCYARGFALVPKPPHARLVNDYAIRAQG